MGIPPGRPGRPIELSAMHAEGLFTLLVGIPLLLILVAGVLRVDETVFRPDSPKEPGAKGRRFAVTDEDGEVVLTDPDGRAFGGRGSRSS